MSLILLASFQQEQRSSLEGLSIVFKAVFLFACLFFLIAGIFKVFEACCGVCEYGYGERPIRTHKGYGTRSVRARMVQGKVDQKKLEAKLIKLKQVIQEVDDSTEDLKQKKDK